MQMYDYLYGAIFGILFAVVTFLVSLRQLSILQQCGYSEKNFFGWFFAKGNLQRKRISLLTLSLVLLFALCGVCFSPLPIEIANALGVLPVIALTALYLFSEKKYALKVAAKKTPRFLRLAVCNLIVLLLLGTGIGLGLSALSRVIDERLVYFLRFLPLALMPLLSPLVLALSSILMKLYEIPHNRAFIRRAKKILEKSQCVKVGITGSFGKTSVKHFAAHMLTYKFQVVATPASYNTPMGIARTVLENGLNCEIFLAEMGARHVGDIKELCELVRPSVGVVTGVCAQHIETFKSLENIKREKGELARFAETCILGKSASDLPAKKALCEGADFSVEDLVCTPNGSSFNLKIGGESARIETQLLGKCAAEDVALAAVLCRTLGMTMSEIEAAAKDLQPVPHRLQKIENGGVTVLDDAYNSNIEGAKNALETLKLFPGRKFVVTPGLVELGELNDEISAQLGAALVGFEVILVGETLVLPVRKGYLGAGGREDLLRTVPTLNHAQNILSSELKSGDCVLFLNDLPDCYH